MIETITLWAVIIFVLYLIYAVQFQVWKWEFAKDGWGEVHSVKEIPLANNLTQMDVVLRRRLLPTLKFSVAYNTKDANDSYRSSRDYNYHCIKTGEPRDLKNLLRKYDRNQDAVIRVAKIEEARMKTLLEGSTK